MTDALATVASVRAALVAAARSPLPMGSAGEAASSASDASIGSEGAVEPRGTGIVAAARPLAARSGFRGMGEVGLSLAPSRPLLYSHFHFPFSF